MNFKIIFVLLYLLILFSSCSTREKNKYYVPCQFKGTVLIIFDKAASKKIDTQNGIRSFSIPNNGVLCVSNLPDEGWKYPDEVFENCNEKQKIPIVHSLESIDTINRFATYPSLGSQGDLIFSVFFVGTKKEILNSKKHFYSRDNLSLFEKECE